MIWHSLLIFQKCICCVIEELTILGFNVKYYLKTLIPLDCKFYSKLSYCSTPGDNINIISDVYLYYKLLIQHLTVIGSLMCVTNVLCSKECTWSIWKKSKKKMYKKIRIILHFNMQIFWCLSFQSFFFARISLLSLLCALLCLTDLS